MAFEANLVLSLGLGQPIECCRRAHSGPNRIDSRNIGHFARKHRRFGGSPAGFVGFVAILALDVPVTAPKV